MIEKNVLEALFGPKARLFGPTSWPSNPVVHHGDPKRFPAPLRCGELSSFETFSRCMETPGFRGEVRFLGALGTQRGTSVRPASAAPLFDAGLNIAVFNFKLPSLEPWRGAIAEQVGIPTDKLELYAFAAPDGPANGSDPHWDPDEVVLIQVSGTKTIFLAPNEHIEHPDMPGTADQGLPEELVGQLRGDVPELPSKWRRVVLRPGSVIYFPRGTWHKTQAQGASFGVSIAFNWPTPVDVITEHLRNRLRQDARWRAPLFGMLRSDSATARHRDHLEALIADLGLSTDAVSATEALLARAPRAERIRRRDPSAGYLTMPLRVSERPGKHGESILEIHTNKGYGKVELELSRAMAPVVRWITARRSSFTLADLLTRFPGSRRADMESLIELMFDHDVLQFDPRRSVGTHLPPPRPRVLREHALTARPFASLGPLRPAPGAAVARARRVRRARRP
jgi:hypothetical protein